MDEQSQLQVVITAKDEASAVLKEFDTNVQSQAASIRDLNLSMASYAEETGGFTAVQAQFGEQAGAVVLALDAQQEAATGAAGALAEAAAAETEAGAGADEMAASVELGAASFDHLSTMAERMFDRMAIRLTLIAAVVAIFTYLKDAVTNAEAANKTYTDQFTESDTVMTQFSATIGNAVLPVMETWKTVLADGEARAMSNKDATNELYSAVFNLGRGFAAAGVVIATAFEVVGDLIALFVEKCEDDFHDISKGFADLAKAAGDISKGDWNTAWKDFSDVFVETHDNVNAGMAVLKDDITAGISEINKIADMQMPTNLSTNVPPKDKPPGGGGKTNPLGADLATATKDYDNLLASAKEDLAKLQDAHENATAAIGDKLATLTADYQKTELDGVAKLKSLSDAHIAAQASITNSIQGITAQMDKLNESYAKQQSANIDTLAKAFVTAKDAVTSLEDQLNNWQVPDSIAKTQITIAQLQAQLADPTDTTSKTVVQTQIDNQNKILQAELDADAKAKQAVQDKLDATNAGLAANAGLAQQYSAQIAAANQFNNESALQQAVDLFNTKQSQDAQAYQSQMQQYSQEMTALYNKAATENATYAAAVLASKQATASKLQDIQQNMNDETEAQKKLNELYTAKVENIKKIVGDAEQLRREDDQKTFNQVDSNVKKEIADYQELAKAMAAAASASSMGGLMALPKTHLASGGIVTSPTVALIGEAGPEAVVPLGSNLGAMGGMTVNINYPSVRNDGDIATIRQQVEQALRPLLQNAKLAYV